jgi:hypothetical protein
MNQKSLVFNLVSGMESLVPIASTSQSDVGAGAERFQETAQMILGNTERRAEGRIIWPQDR